ncbi:ankyrin repeat protein [Podospora aff. communis PSN243]|uniref:Ankyrin repeat protein n=1 Tax=Podospora aff. communis PSN243 TaxID=3040156 RepID=A0AAV9G4P3_9PEZI|nr:ankyrin repeat protein [Podospora aff. communis PSN243]
MSWDIFSTGSSRSREKSSKEARTADHGLHTLVAKNEQAPDCVDIVAIHGLNGHYLRTWTDERSGVNWLESILPGVVPAARVMSFSYNSMLQFSKSTADVTTFAQQLLEALVAARESSFESQRPIIFLCHSLGGLVLKKAVLLAMEDTGTSRYADLLERFSGVMFFGTPHRGSGYASWASLGARLLALGAFGTSTNVQLAEDLEPGSRNLAKIAEEFRDLCLRGELKMAIASCYETDRMSFLGNVVVDQDSAVLGLGREKETVIPMEGDHRSMCRFSNDDEKRFRPVARWLRTVTKDSLESVSHAVQLLMGRLDTVNYQAHRARNPTAVEGTCGWILEHPKYQDWLRSPDSVLLWVSGDPGCGKSVLASFLIDVFTGMARETDLNSSAATALQALLHQLFSQETPLATAAVAQLKQRPLNVENIQQLWHIFTESTTRKGATRTTICIFDGLDECEGQSRREFLRAISEFLAVVPAKEGAPERANKERKAPRLKILITSRPENQIKVAFDKTPSMKQHGKLRYSTMRLRGEDETDAVSADVAKVIRFKINALVEQGLPPALLATVERELVTHADRTFLWVSLVLDLLEEKVEAGASQRELDDVLRTRDIFSIYSQLLASRSDSPRARKALAIILVTPGDYLRAVSTQSKQLGTRTLADAEYDMVFPFENHMKSLCGHFVRIIKNKVYLVHETAREFLLKSLSSHDISVFSSSPFQHSFSLFESRTLLLNICVTYLYCLSRSPSPVDDKGRVKTPAGAFLHYAAHLWMIRYLQNLCHPLFPGFHVWIAEYWRPDLPQHRGVSDDAIQDFYLERFHLDSHMFLAMKTNDNGNDGSYTDTENSASDEEQWESAEEDLEQTAPVQMASTDRAPWRSLNPSMQADLDFFLSMSNPGSLGNHYFPLHLDPNTGLVRLNHPSQRALSYRRLKEDDAVVEEKDKSGQPPLLS